jgi:hypothetical protein
MGQDYKAYVELETKRIVIFEADDVETGCAGDLYDEWGNIGDCDGGCGYILNEKEYSCDWKESIEENIGGTLADLQRFCDENDIPYDEDEDEDDDLEELKELIIEFIKDNGEEYHSDEYKYVNYYDGHNWQTLLLSFAGDVFYEELDEDESKEIIEDFLSKGEKDLQGYYEDTDGGYTWRAIWYGWVRVDTSKFD